MIPWLFVTLAWWLAHRVERTLRVEWTAGRGGADRLAITGRCHPHGLPWHAARGSVQAARRAARPAA